jgi:GTP-binding protein Era
MAQDSEFRSGQVAIVGRPNVGKSTLLNRLVGQKISITARKPQTTRHSIRGVSSSPERQLVLVDTPGFQSSIVNALGGNMNRTVANTLAEADVIVLVIVAGRPSAEDDAIIRRLPADKPLIVALNKVDRIRDRSSLLPQIEQLAARLPARAYVPVSAQDGYQLERLLEEIESALPMRAALFPADQLTDRDERFFAAEFIREKIFRALGDELPYRTTVTIERFEELKQLRRIHATILVEKPSHKAIVIGDRGARLKAIATSARRELEVLFGTKVYLQIWVKVRRGWSNDQAELKRLGYG